MKTSTWIASALAGAIATTTLAGPVLAGPTVLRDDQLRDLAVTPVLGRGYSLSTNTYQSICLTDFAKTKPSYNFHYTFQDIDETGKVENEYTVGGDARYDGSVWGVNIDVKLDGKVTRIDNKDYRNHYILVTSTVDSYYSSIDEAKAHISDAARELLTSNDVPGFFDACGMYYVRSIGRTARFVSVFTYKDTNEFRDTTFEAHLKSTIKGWGQTVTVNADSNGSFASEAHDKFLTIETTAFGLGKDAHASLISSDEASFKDALKAAFIAMQQEDTGLVTSIEVVPWVESSEFQRALKLETAKSSGDGKTISPYAQKRILNQNGEFLAEVDRVTRAKLNVYYKAKQCRARIDLDDKTGGQLRPELASAEVVNHRLGTTLPLSQLDAAVTQGSIDQLFAEYRQFLYGDESAANPGAVACVRDLLTAGITTRSHRDVETCTKIEQQFAVISGQIVDEYCMPRIAPAKPK